MKNLKKLTAIGLAILVAFTIVGYQEVSAETANAGEHFYVENTTEGANATDGWSYSYKLYDPNTVESIVINDSGSYTIKKACECADSAYHTSWYIRINGSNVNLTIEDVYMKTAYRAESAPMVISDNSNVKLFLVGTNAFYSDLQGRAGIQISDSSTSSLEITSYTNGTLYAYGGRNAAGIGGSGSTSNITISGGNIYAKGGDMGAGIGGGISGSASNIVIYSSASIKITNSTYSGHTADYAAFPIGIGGANLYNTYDVTFVGYSEEEYEGCITRNGSCNLVANTAVVVPEESTPQESTPEESVQSSGLTSGLIIVDTASK